MRSHTKIDKILRLKMSLCCNKKNYNWLIFLVEKLFFNILFSNMYEIILEIFSLKSNNGLQLFFTANIPSFKPLYLKITKL